jgi:hypothetical protein
MGKIAKTIPETEVFQRRALPIPTKPPAYNRMIAPSDS